MVVSGGDNQTTSLEVGSILLKRKVKEEKERSFLRGNAGIKEGGGVV